MLSGSVAKSASNVATRERRSSVLFLTAIVSWGRFRQELILGRGWLANLVFGINDGDSSRYSLRETESICGLFYDIDRNGDGPRRCPFSLSPELAEVNGKEEMAQPY